MAFAGYVALMIDAQESYAVIYNGLTTFNGDGAPQSVSGLFWLEEVPYNLAHVFEQLEQAYPTVKAVDPATVWKRQRRTRPSGTSIPLPADRPNSRATAGSSARRSVR